MCLDLDNVEADGLPNFEERDFASGGELIDGTHA
jgi:hypothetical protein